ncbi:hypothetical protein [Microbacterium timonense]|uniref:hypothetical protein n=1 Tax=Microbacterium timonense TaxID=2086576 RepID=UPI000D0E812F|nr:hypothetical protein [Microbacterium timonense]
MTPAPLAAGSPADQLAIVVGELGRLIGHLEDAAVVARGLSDATGWQATAATAFHERATRWAGDVSGLGCLAQTARADADLAWGRALMTEPLTGLPFLGAGR